MTRVGMSNDKSYEEQPNLRFVLVSITNWCPKHQIHFQTEECRYCVKEGVYGARSQD